MEESLCRRSRIVVQRFRAYNIPCFFQQSNELNIDQGECRKAVLLRPSDDPRQGRMLDQRIDMEDDARTVVHSQ